MSTSCKCAYLLMISMPPADADVAEVIDNLAENIPAVIGVVHAAC